MILTEVRVVVFLLPTLMDCDDVTGEESLCFVPNPTFLTGICFLSMNGCVAKKGTWAREDKSTVFANMSRSSFLLAQFPPNRCDLHLLLLLLLPTEPVGSPLLPKVGLRVTVEEEPELEPSITNLTLVLLYSMNFGMTLESAGFSKEISTFLTFIPARTLGFLLFFFRGLLLSLLNLVVFVSFFFNFYFRFGFSKSSFRFPRPSSSPSLQLRY